MPGQERPEPTPAPESRPAGARAGRMKRAWAATKAFVASIPQLAPAADDIVAGALPAALLVVLVDTVAISLAVPWPAGGWPVRLGHRAFDALETLGLGSLLAIGAAGVVGPLGRRGARAWLAWLLLGALAVLGMWGIISEQLRREALVVLNGKLVLLLYPLYLVLCGLAIPAAYVVGGLLSRDLPSRIAAVGAGLATSIAHHGFLRDDYHGVHSAVQWTAFCLMSGALGPSVARRLGWAPRRLPYGSTLAALGLLAVLWAPPNAVRLQLFRESGSGSAFVLARLAWRSPPLPAPVSLRELPRLDAPTPRPIERLTRLPPRVRAPVVVLISVEATRADTLSIDSHLAGFPNFRGLIESGAYFPRAVAPGSQTSVTLSTLFSGRYFSQLRWEETGTGSQRFLYPAADPTERFPTLLGRAGVQTEDFLGLIFLSDRFGLARGFAKEHQAVTDRRHAAATEVLGPLIKRLGRVRAKERLFLYAHVMEPHEPYDRGALKTGTDYQRYLSEIGVVDQWIGKLVRQLRTKLPERAYLIICGDHGEAFGEHGTRFHTKTLYDEMMRVPLIVWGPGIPPGRYDELAGLIDIGPTVLELFGLPAPDGHMGRSLLPFVRGETNEIDRPVIAEGRLRRALLTRDGLKIIDDTFFHTVEAYDLEADPGETVNLYEHAPERVAAPLAQLRSFFERYTLREGGYVPPYKR